MKQSEVLEKRQVVLQRFAEADAGVDYDLGTGNASLLKDGNPTFEVVKDVEGHVIIARIDLHDVGRPLGVHDADGQASLGGERGEGGIEGEARHVVDEVCSGLMRS